MRYKKTKKEKIRTTITLDADLFEESGWYIENLSGYLNECLKRGIKEAKKKEKEEEELRIMQVMSNKNKAMFNDEAREIASYDWVKRN